MKKFLLLAAALAVPLTVTHAQVDKSIAVSRVSDTAKFTMQDGTVMYGKVDLKSFELATAHGQLNIPVTDVIRIQFARKPDPEFRKRIAKFVKDLGDGDFNTRDKASVELTKIGRRAFAELERACISDDAEVRSRASRIMESIRVDDDEESGFEEDEIVTRTLTYRGTLKPESFAVQTRFGSFKLDKTDAVSMTANVDEFTKQCRLTGNFVVARAFLDTKISVKKGDRLDFTAAGLLGYPSAQQTFTPEGKPDAGMWQTFPFGSVVGKIGPNGPIFKIGDKLSMRAEQDGVLHLAIVHAAHDPNATGWYKIKVIHQPAPPAESR